MCGTVVRAISLWERRSQPDARLDLYYVVLVIADARMVVDSIEYLLEPSRR